MTGVAELLAAVGESAPVQRVRNYHLTDREASPRSRDFLTAMQRTDGEVCVRWPGPPGDCVVRYADPHWECAKHNRFRGRTLVETIDAERVRAWLRRSSPELVAHESVRDQFEERCSGSHVGHARMATALADGGENRGDGESSGKKDHSEETERRSDPPNRVRIERRADVVTDTDLNRVEAQALAAALPARPGEVVFRLPLVLAEESVLESVVGSDCLFVGEVVPERETECAYYVRQGHRGCWVPKAEATFYELADGVALDAEPPESTEASESA
jgi:hypothetical protein